MVWDGREGELGADFGFSCPAKHISLQKFGGRELSFSRTLCKLWVVSKCQRRAGCSILVLNEPKIMEEVVLVPLDALEASLSTLLTSLTTTPTYSTAPTASKALLAADDDLTHSLTTLKKHQQNYARILHLRDEATRLEDQIKSIIGTCGELRSEI